MTRYVAGFLFDAKAEQVALIRKNKPDWQRGKLNAIGGKIESGETPHDAMVREFQEETGLQVPSWESFCTMRGTDCKVYFFRTWYDLSLLKSPTDELISVFQVNDLPKLPVIPNLHWLIPMAKDLSIQVAEVLA